MDFLLCDITDGLATPYQASASFPVGGMSENVFFKTKHTSGCSVSATVCVHTVWQEVNRSN